MSAWLRQHAWDHLCFADLLRSGTHKRKSLHVGLDEHRGRLLQKENTRDFLARTACAAAPSRDDQHHCLSRSRFLRSQGELRSRSAWLSEMGWCHESQLNRLRRGITSKRCAGWRGSPPSGSPPPDKPTKLSAFTHFIALQTEHGCVVSEKQTPGFGMLRGSFSDQDSPRMCSPASRLRLHCSINRFSRQESRP